MFNMRLKELRKSAGLSQKALADMLFVSQAAVAKWELDKSTPTPEMLVKIAEVFNVTTDYLLGTETQKTPALTAKDERDIARELEKTLNRLDDADGALMFDGEPLDDEARELLRASLENQIRMAKIIAKQKYTPKNTGSRTTRTKDREMQCTSNWPPSKLRSAAGEILLMSQSSLALLSSTNRWAQSADITAKISGRNLSISTVICQNI